MNFLIERIEKANTTLIGYDSRNELNANKLLNFIPNLISFTGTGENIHTGAAMESSKILDHFNSVANIRDHKIDSILYDNKIQYVVIDITGLYFGDAQKPEPQYHAEKSRELKKFIVEIQNKIYAFNSVDNPLRLKLILLNKLYGNGLTGKSFMNGSQSVYISDLVIQFWEDSISVVKDRTSNTITINNTVEEIRNLTIESLLNDNID